MSRMNNLALAVSTGPMAVFLSSDAYKHISNFIVLKQINNEHFHLEVLPECVNKNLIHKPYGKKYRNLPFKY